MTIEITLLPISCRTLHKVKKFLLNLVANVSVWFLLIFGILMILIPKYIAEFCGNYKFSDYDVFVERVGGSFIILGSIVIMTIIYDIKIHWCIKEKSE